MLYHVMFYHVMFYHVMFDIAACVMSGTSVTANNILPASIKTSSALNCQISCQNLLACQVMLVSIFFNVILKLCALGSGEKGIAYH